MPIPQEGPAPSKPNREVTIEFKKDILPIFDRHCNSCHYQGHPKGYWGEYKEVVANAKKIVNAVLSENPFMPPMGQPPLLEEDARKLRKWFEMGAPEGGKQVTLLPEASPKEESPSPNVELPPVAQPPAVIQRCQGCHRVDGAGNPPFIPPLAGKSREYLIEQLTRFKNGDRPSPTMSPIARGLSEQEIEEAATYYSEQ